jgi:hypothetical protein
MTEADWLSPETYCSGVGSALEEMLNALRRKKTSLWKWTSRKSRLFACACCRRAWDLLADEADRQAVECAEQVADRQRPPKDLRPSHYKTKPIWLGLLANDERATLQTRSNADELLEVGLPGWNFHVSVDPERKMLCRPAFYASKPTHWGDPYNTAIDARALLHFKRNSESARQEESAQCCLLRDVVGPPAVRSLTDSTWLTSTVVQLARAIYEERAFDRIPILADALEDAGCSDADILAHCRGGGEHVRGCWVVDLLTGRE